MIKLGDLYAFVEGSFDFLLVIDEEEKVLHVNSLLVRACDSTARGITGKRLEEIVTPRSLDSLRTGMVQAREGLRGVVVCSPQGPSNPCSILLKTGYVDTTAGGVHLFFGSQVDGLNRFAETDKDERVKELFCIYSVAEWIEVSPSVEEFFNRLPEYLSRGMQFPESTVVYSVYQGREYGQPIASQRTISVTMVVNRKNAGSIQVGYVDEQLETLPEEQRMLNEIGRMLSLAVERKELSARLVLKQEEEASYRARLHQLEEEIDTRTRQVEEQRGNLERIDGYLERVNRDWEESKTYLETVLKGIPDPVALIDRNRTLVMTNRENVASGDKCHKTLFDNDMPCQDCRLARIVREKTPITLTIQHEGRHLEVHALPIFNADHEVDGIMEFYRDVTLEKTYEQQLSQADRMASLGELVSGIGHEINNPNQFIRGNVKILKQALDDMLPIVDAHYEQQGDLRIARLPYKFFRDHVMTLVDDMAHGSERIKSIVEGLKRFARRDEGLLIDKVEVNTAIEACVRLTHNEVHKHAEIELDLAPDLPTFVGNSQKIEQVLVNLIVNAAQAIPDEHKGLIRVQSRFDDGRVIVEVEDNGKGMNEKTIKQIFDPFFTTKRASGGTGLGLPIAYRIVEEHGGTIGVQSHVGQGTTFTVEIPVAPEGQAGPAGAGDGPQPDRRAAAAESGSDEE
ncbi:MAG: PAS domain-containing protein [Candidatus Eisenbacteria sp.]|nr:PAS domain-containing protein [Candidatus Eisenbacteria bacterium]